MTSELDRAHCSHDDGRSMNSTTAKAWARVLTSGASLANVSHVAKANITRSGGDALLTEEEGSEYLLDNNLKHHSLKCK